MSSSFNEIHYPNLTNCKVQLTPAVSSSKPAVQLSPELYESLRKDVRKPYDFSLEKSILKRKEDLDQEMKLATADSKEELQQNVLVKMKSVTGAADDVCVSLLENNNYNLKTSIEAFLSPK
eukprot:CAMPEP_0119545622 /NCGR_PEP_ID=MMETSP1352-20130426/321_1 /TAXON_ID=265584 /ORGANISM="Stauroneis constricta, Strain CCMP1120" /LENGTH=120 /DNA_ID=CAMNT_0007590195 /DNA_START=103 /DNA_END=465 /DNA_ORIENTATION=+